MNSVLPEALLLTVVLVTLNTPWLSAHPSAPRPSLWATVPTAQAAAPRVLNEPDAVVVKSRA